MKILSYFLLRFQKAFERLLQIPGYCHDYLLFFMKNADDERFVLRPFESYPCLGDKTSDTPFEPHYTYHPAWAARILKKLNPKKHIDISSTLTFCTIVSAFIPTEFYDYRPANISLTGLKSKRGDLLDLPFVSNSVESISCMHTIEHIGLGRYGDAIDPTGDLKAIRELIRVTKKGGSILFVTPVGKRALRFNAHRIYAYDEILKYFTTCHLKEFALVPDNVFEVGMLTNPPKSVINKQSWGCGCFWFIKK